MAFSPDDLVPHIPYLRRHARLLTGDKSVGDEYVRLCLELVVAEPARLDGVDLREGLFAAFYSCWKAVNPEPKRPIDAPKDDQERLEQSLAKLAPIEQQVLLLSAVEDFAVAQIAGMLGLDADTVGDHLMSARHNLQQTSSVSVLIIEDEPMIVMELKELVQEMGLMVVATAADEDEAIAAGIEKQPGLVLADIQLENEGDGVTAARSILQNYEVPIVFVTGYPERLLTGEGLEPAFVVAKPFRKEGLKATIAQALSTYRAPAQAAEHRSQLLAKLRKLTGGDVQKDG